MSALENLSPHKIIPVQSWSEMTSKVFDYRKDTTGRWIFRGVGDHTHKLIPKIGRPGARRHVSSGDDLPFDRKDEGLMLDYFIRAAPPYLRHLPMSQLEWLAVAQHHGMATRLLDWTESLLVAAYFAIQSNRPNKIPAIFAVKNVPLAPREMYDKLDALDDVTLFYPPHMSPRIPAQNSVFTVHKSPGQPWVPLECHCLLLQGSQPITYRLNLDSCGVNQASIFPDIDGLAVHLSWLYKWSRLPETIYPRSVQGN